MVKTNTDIVKNAVDRFLLYARINTASVFWRLKTLLGDKKNKKIGKKKAKNISVLTVLLMSNNLERKMLKYGLDSLKELKYKFLI